MLFFKNKTKSIIFISILILLFIISVYSLTNLSLKIYNNGSPIEIIETLLLIITSLLIVSVPFIIFQQITFLYFLFLYSKEKIINYKLWKKLEIAYFLNKKELNVFKENKFTNYQFANYFLEKLLEKQKGRTILKLILLIIVSILLILLIMSVLNSLEKPQYHIAWYIVFLIIFSILLLCSIWSILKYSFLLSFRKYKNYSDAQKDKKIKTILFVTFNFKKWK
ncbi:hypothetical protein [Mycoplasmopsis sturni]|uniref:hypothetical protein n=1 Tax=Mycoplasmopsis sturni TaxID=39047 RepID=UPI000560AC34|nr:hypothetical protein [Mycoplasmopsis sturni]